MIAKPSPSLLWDQTSRWAVAVILAVLGFSTQAAASLGGDLGSIQTDQVRLQGAVMRVTSSDTFTVHEMRASTGTTVREYVSSSGKVFGVAWDGPTVPDLRQVLGDYFPAYIEAAQAAQKKRLGHGPIRIEAPTFIVEQSGHPRAFVGRAYVPQFVPTGIGTELVR
ncbi:MAG: DUF2844 domain-containing protein [Acidobacteriota bacterium]